MIDSNSALYIGIVTACVLEQVPTAMVMVTREARGYQIKGHRKIGDGSDARSFVTTHAFADAETRAASAQHLGDSARIAGDSIAYQLLQAR